MDRSIAALPETKQPKISVLLPVRNASRYLVSAIESILAQSERDFELLAIDNHSTDGSFKILERYAANDRRIVLRRSSAQTLSKLLNEGLAVAQGELIARMDADDIAHHDRFAVQAAYLHRHADVVAVGASLLHIDGEDAPICFSYWPCHHEAIDRQLLRGKGKGGLPHPAAMIRRLAMIEIGGYREDLNASQDKDLWLRLGEIGRLANLPFPLLAYRQHSESVGASRVRQQLDSKRKALADAYRRRGLVMPPDLRLEPPQRIAPPRYRWFKDSIKGGNTRTAWKHGRLLWRERPKWSFRLKLAARFLLCPWCAVGSRIRHARATREFRIFCLDNAIDSDKSAILPITGASRRRGEAASRYEGRAAG